MLARIIYKRGLAKTRLGTLALAAASLDDGIAWCLLAIVLANLKNSVSIATLAQFGDNRRVDECTRVDGVNHPQRWPGARRNHTDTIALLSLSENYARS